MILNTRSRTESGTTGAIDCDDNVELEKSNVLLMGPTGSGMTTALIKPTCAELGCRVSLLCSISFVVVILGISCGLPI